MVDNFYVHVYSYCTFIYYLDFQMPNIMQTKVMQKQGY